MELFFGLLLSLTAAVVGVWHIASRERDRPIHGPKDDGTLGLPHLQRWSEKQHKPRFESVRRNLPFMEISKIFIGLLLLTLAGGVALAGLAIFQVLDQRSDAQVADRVEDITTMYARATTADDPLTQYELLVEARAAATALIDDRGADVDQGVLDARSAIQSDIETLTQSTEITTIQQLGSIPLADLNRNPQLFRSGGKTYLLTDALYEVDAVNRSLIRLLSPGDEVSGVGVGQLLAGGHREDGPLVVDAGHAYILDQARGTWTVEDLGESEVGSGLPETVAAIDVFDHNLYAIDPESQTILKFAGGDYEMGPEDWTGEAATDELSEAIDLYVNGRVYVLHDDGRILEYYLNALDNTLAPQVIPPMSDPAAMSPGSDGEFLYVVDQADGRIARVDAEGNLNQQFMLAGDESNPTGILDITVDESTQIAILLTADGLYTVRLPSVE